LSANIGKQRVYETAYLTHEAFNRLVEIRTANQRAFVMRLTRIEALTSGVESNLDANRACRRRNERWNERRLAAGRSVRDERCSRIGRCQIRGVTVDVGVPHILDAHEHLDRVRHRGAEREVDERERRLKVTVVLAFVLDAEPQKRTAARGLVDLAVSFEIRKTGRDAGRCDAAAADLHAVGRNVCDERPDAERHAVEDRAVRRDGRFHAQTRARSVRVAQRGEFSSQPADVDRREDARVRGVGGRRGRRALRGCRGGGAGGVYAPAAVAAAGLTMAARAAWRAPRRLMSGMKLRSREADARFDTAKVRLRLG
jgi:hypothetical protein